MYKYGYLGSCLTGVVLGGSDKGKEDKQSCISNTDFTVNFSLCASDSHSLMHILETCFQECNPQGTLLRALPSGLGRHSLPTFLFSLRPFLLFCLGHFPIELLKIKRITFTFLYSTALEISIQNSHFSRMFTSFRGRRHSLIKTIC